MLYPRSFLRTSLLEKVHSIQGQRLLFLGPSLGAIRRDSTAPRRPGRCRVSSPAPPGHTSSTCVHQSQAREVAYRGTDQRTHSK